MGIVDFKGVLKAVLIFFVFATFARAAPEFIGYNHIYNASEDSLYLHNLIFNLTGYDNNETFSFETDQNYIVWTNASGTFNVTPDDVSEWIYLNETDNHMLVIDARYDNQTGRFGIPLQVKNETADTSSSAMFKYFDVYAINDAPYFLNLENNYTLYQEQNFYRLINARDEEEHYPLFFNLTFINNCTHASWTGKQNGHNCSLFNFTAVSSTSAYMNFTPDENDVGEYWAVAHVVDAGDAYSCPHAYCDSSSYEQNKTSEDFLIKFSILSYLTINVSNCTNRFEQEGVEFSCQIKIRTTQENDNLKIWSAAGFNNGYSGPISNKSWFYGNETTQSSNFSKIVDVTINATKKEVGNWSIDFNVEDSTTNESASQKIYLFINWTESNVSLNSIPNFTIYENTSFSVNAFDNDLLIQDKGTKNEDLVFESNESWVIFQNKVTYNGNNYTTANFLIDYDAVKSFAPKNYTIRLNVTDSAGNFDERFFRIEVLSDNAPVWNSTEPYVFESNEGDNVYINLSEFVSDADNDTITFTYTNDTPFKHFNMTSDGIINFTSDNYDVGQHILIINASDGSLSTPHEFNFTIHNINQAPVVKQISDVNAQEGVLKQIQLDIYDNDLLIPVEQAGFYNESHTVETTIRNISSVKTPISFEFNFSTTLGNHSIWLAEFTPEGDNAGMYNVSVNVSDASGNWSIVYFLLNITAENDPPNMSFVENKSYTILDSIYIDVNATDEEDSPTLPENGNLTYTLVNLTAGGDFLKINKTSGVINFSLNESYAGVWVYNVSVNDTEGATDSQIFEIRVYGKPNITCPSQSYVFNWKENQTASTDFCVDFSPNGTNLVYKIYIDRIVYENSSAYYYTNLTSDSSLRNESVYLWTESENFSFVFTPDFADESYGMFKNLSLFVYDPLHPELNDSKTWRINISHTNQPVRFTSHIPDQGPNAINNPITINLSNYFSDADYFDKRIQQNVNFSVQSNTTSQFNFSFDGWILTINSDSEGSELINLTAHEYDGGSEIGEAVSNNFEVSFVTSQGTQQSGGGGGGTGSMSNELRHFAIKLIFPRDIVLYPGGSVDIPFSVINTGDVELRGIALNSSVLFGGVFNENLKVSLSGQFIDLLKVKEQKDFVMHITAGFGKAGRYKATVYAYVSSPKFTDWGDFYIDLKRLNETEAKEYMIFTEKLVVENPECLELKEKLKEAQSVFKSGDYKKTIELCSEIVSSCEESIKKGNLKPHLSFVQKTFYFTSALTIASLVGGFLFYLYKRIRFNKLEIQEGI